MRTARLVRRKRRRLVRPDEEIDVRGRRAAGRWSESHAGHPLGPSQWVSDVDSAAMARGEARDDRVAGPLEPDGEVFGGQWEGLFGHVLEPLAASRDGAGVQAGESGCSDVRTAQRQRSGSISERFRGAASFAEGECEPLACGLEHNGGVRDAGDLAAEDAVSDAEDDDAIRRRVVERGTRFIGGDVALIARRVGGGMWT